MGLHEPRMGEAMAELPVGEHLEEWEPGALGGEGALAHHDLCLLDQDGGVLAARRIADGLAGVGELHLLVAAHAEDPGQVAVGIETDRGLLVWSAPTGTTIARSPATARWWRRSRCWPGPTRA
jgi:hypothetical protein